MADEKAKSINTKQEQIISDEELLQKTIHSSTFEFNKYKVEELVTMIMTVAEMIAGFKLYPYEYRFGARIVRSLVIDDGDTLTALFARQTGKSTTVAVVVVACMIMLPLIAHLVPEGVETPVLKFRNGLWVGVYGPDYERAGIIGGKIYDTITSRNARTVLSDPDIGMQFPEKLNKMHSIFPRGSRLLVKSAGKRVSIEGDTHHLVITEETQEILSTKIKKSIHPMLSATNGTMVHIGSAYPQRVYFYDICKLNKKEDIERKKLARCHYEVDYREAQQYNDYYKRYIAKQKRVLGEFSDEFKMSYELYWAIEKGMFITEEQLVTHIGADYSVTNWDKGNDHVIGLDIAKKFDSTVATVGEVDWENPITLDVETNTVRHNKKIKNWLEIGGTDYDAQFYILCDFFDNFRWSILVIDATGVGEHMFDRLYNKYTPQGKIVVPFIYSLQSKSDGYLLLQKELFAEPGRLKFPNSEKAKSLKKQQYFVNQMSNLVKNFVGSYMQVENSDDEIHDDYADSLMLFNYGVEVQQEASAMETVTAQSIYKNYDNEQNFWKTRR